MTFHVFSERYPPVNRKPTGLQMLEIQMVDRVGAVNLDPNRAAELGYLKAIPVRHPAFRSVLSGRPGYLYRTYDGIEVALAEDEMVRLLRHALRPAEVLSLHRQFGAFFETHADFYDENTGVAVQPMND